MGSPPQTRKRLLCRRCNTQSPLNGVSLNSIPLRFLLAAVDSRLPVSGLNWPPEWGTLSLWSLISLIYISKCLNFWSWVHLVQELVENQLLGRQSGLVGPAISQIDPASRGGVELVPGWGTLGF